MKENLYFSLEDIVDLIDYEKGCGKNENGKLEFLRDIKGCNNKCTVIMNYCAEKLEIDNFTAKKSKNIVEKHVVYNPLWLERHGVGGAYSPALKQIVLNCNEDEDDFVKSASHEFTHYLLYNYIYSPIEILSTLFQKEKTESIPKMLSIDASYGFSGDGWRDRYIARTVEDIASVYEYYAHNYGKNYSELNEKIRGFTRCILDGLDERHYFIGFVKARLLQKKGYKLRGIAKINFRKIKIIEK